MSTPTRGLLRVGFVMYAIPVLPLSLFASAMDSANNQ